MIFSRKNRRDGTVGWFIRYDSPDGPKQEKVPPVLTASGDVARRATKDDARDLLTLRKAQVLSKTWRDPKAPPVPEPEPDLGPTFEKFAERFLTDHPGKRRSNHYPSNVRELVKHFGARRLHEITRSDLDTYRVTLSTTAQRGRLIAKTLRVEGGPERLTRPPLCSTTVLKRLRTLHRMFRMAVRWGVLAYNPASDLEKPSAGRGRLRRLTRGEYEQLEAAASPWARPMLRLAVATGLRLKEVATLRWEDVDASGGVFYVPQDTKTGTRPVPLSKTAALVLAAQKERRKTVARETGKLSAFVFMQDDGTDYSSDFQRRRISEAARAAGKLAALGSGVGFHVLRHTAASWMVEAGVPLYEVQKVLGHSTPTLTMRYAHLQPEHLRNAVNALDVALGVEEVTPEGDDSMTTCEAPASVPRETAL